jgi:hypothetical protein
MAWSCLVIFFDLTIPVINSRVLFRHSRTVEDGKMGSASDQLGCHVVWYFFFVGTDLTVTSIDYFPQKEFVTCL